MDMNIVWFLLGMFFIVIECILPTMITIFFGAGALSVFALNYIFENKILLDYQIIIFLSISVIFIIISRFTSIFKGKSKEHNESEFIGKNVKVIEKITPNEPGKVEFMGSPWIAKSSETLKVGTKAIILKQENITLTVKSINNN